MKKLLFIMAVMLPIWVSISCSEENKEKAFIEKHLGDIGNGKYAFDIECYNLTKVFSWNHSKMGGFFGLREDNLPFSSYLIDYRMKEKDNEYIDEMKDLFIIDWFNTNFLFDEYEFVSQKHLFDIDIVSRVRKDSLKEHGWTIDVLMTKDDKMKEYEDHYIIVKKEKIPVTEYTYKLDNSKLSKICIVKHPEDGYKIVMLTIDDESIIKR